jgi:undecaprenyl-diphosphatase
MDASRRVLLLAGGAAVVVVAALGAVLLREKVGFVIAGDAGVERAAHRAVIGTPWLLTAARDVTHIGDTLVRYAIGLAVLGYLLVRRLWRLAGFFVVAVVGGQLLVDVVKRLVDRARPVLPDPVAHAGGPSFPSGHAMGSAILYGAIAVILLPALPRRARPVVVGLVVLLVAAVSTSRVLLGVHFTSDVTAGALLGAGWLAVAVGVCRPWRQDLTFAAATRRGSTRRPRSA